MRCERISIIGMGALGILYGDFFARALGWDKVTFLAEGERFKRYQTQNVTCNGRPCPFRVVNGEEQPAEEPADLLIFAVKATALEEAVSLAEKGHVSPPTRRGAC